MSERSVLFTNSNALYEFLGERVDAQVVTDFARVRDTFIFDLDLVDAITAKPEREEPGMRCVVSLERLRRLRPEWDYSLLPTLDRFRKDSAAWCKSIFLYDGRILYELLWTSYNHEPYLMFEQCVDFPPDHFADRDLLFLSGTLNFNHRCYINTLLQPATMAYELQLRLSAYDKYQGLQLGAPLTYQTLQENLITELTCLL